MRSMLGSITSLSAVFSSSQSSDPLSRTIPRLSLSIHITGFEIRDEIGLFDKKVC